MVDADRAVAFPDIWQCPDALVQMAHVELSHATHQYLVGQRLINRDGVSGDVTLNSQGKSIFGPGEPFGWPSRRGRGQ